MHFNIVEIGCCDFDTVLHEGNFNDGTTILLIDPIKEFLDNIPIPENLDVYKLEAAIGPSNGKTMFSFFPPEKIEELGLPGFIRGCSSLLDKPEFCDMFDRAAAEGTFCVEGFDPQQFMNLDYKLESIIEKREVNAMTLFELIDKFKIDTIDLLKIDTEGIDYIILQDVIKAIKDKIIQPPRQILFEVKHMPSSPILANLLGSFYDLQYRIGYIDVMNALLDHQSLWHRKSINDNTLIITT